MLDTLIVPLPILTPLGIWWLSRWIGLVSLGKTLHWLPSLFLNPSKRWTRTDDTGTSHKRER